VSWRFETRNAWFGITVRRSPMRGGSGQALTSTCPCSSERPSILAPAVRRAGDLRRRPRGGDGAARRVVYEVARRIALLLLEPVRRLLGEWLPYRPHVEVSSLGEAAALSGALAVGLRNVFDNVVATRPRVSRA
jgi:hypothetical protein